MSLENICKAPCVVMYIIDSGIPKSACSYFENAYCKRTLFIIFPSLSTK